MIAWLLDDYVSTNLETSPNKMQTQLWSDERSFGASETNNGHEQKERQLANILILCFITAHFREFETACGKLLNSF